MPPGLRTMIRPPGRRLWRRAGLVSDRRRFGGRPVKPSSAIRAATVFSDTLQLPCSCHCHQSAAVPTATPLTCSVVLAHIVTKVGLVLTAPRDPANNQVAHMFE